MKNYKLLLYKMKNLENILLFWFGNLEKELKPIENKEKIWFSKNDDNDKYIMENFLPVLEQSSKNPEDFLTCDSNMLLASIILFDQFTRNIFRNKPESFQYDNLALDLCFQTIKKGYDKEFHIIKRVFIYLPLEHSEKLENQEMSLKMYQTLVDESPVELKDQMQFFKTYAEKHYEIIKKFGRFPHRNKILNRESTPEEIEFLKQPNSSF